MSKALILFAVLQWSVCVEYMGPCETNLDCETNYNSHYYCMENRCKHENIFPLGSTGWLGVVLILVIAGLTNAGGIGGGAVIVPVYMFLFNYTIGDSVPLAKATIFGGAVVTLFVNANRRYPNQPSRPLNDYRLSSFIIPLMLSGSMIGVMLTKIIPSAFILCTMVSYLWHSSYHIALKAMAYTRLENEQKLFGKTKGLDQTSAQKPGFNASHSSFDNFQKEGEEKFNQHRLYNKSSLAVDNVAMSNSAIEDPSVLYVQTSPTALPSLLEVLAPF